MSLSAITSTSSSYPATSTQATLKALEERLTVSSSTSSDTVTISREALQALTQSQNKNGGPPPMTDDMAAKMGTDIKKQNADLFTQLDTDEDGVLSADEAEAGKDTIDQAIKSGTLKPPEKPSETGNGASAGASSTTDAAQSTEELINQLISSLHEQGVSNEEISKTLGVTEKQVQDVLQSGS